MCSLTSHEPSHNSFTEEEGQGEFWWTIHSIHHIDFLVNNFCNQQSALLLRLQNASSKSVTTRLLGPGVNIFIASVKTNKQTKDYKFFDTHSKCSHVKTIALLEYSLSACAFLEASSLWEAKASWWVSIMIFWSIVPAELRLQTIPVQAAERWVKIPFW